MEALDYYVMCQYGPEHWFETEDAMCTDCGHCPPVPAPQPEQMTLELEVAL